MSNGWDEGERAVYGDIGLNTIELQTWIRAKKKKKKGNRQASVPWGRLWNSPLQWNDSPFWCFHEALLFLDCPPPPLLPPPAQCANMGTQSAHWISLQALLWMADALSQTCKKSAWECVRRETGARECTLHLARLHACADPVHVHVTLSISQIIKWEQI